MGNSSSRKKKKKARKKPEADSKFSDVDDESHEEETNAINNSTTSGNEYREYGSENETASVYSGDSYDSLVNSAKDLHRSNLSQNDPRTQSSIWCDIHSASTNSQYDASNPRDGDPSTSSDLRYNVPSGHRNLRYRDSSSSSNLRYGDPSTSSTSQNDVPSTSSNLRYGDPSTSSNLRYGDPSSSSNGNMLPFGDMFASNNIDKDNDEPESRVSKLVIASIDFGTTFSGYAYHLRHNPVRIYTSMWHATRSNTVKAPTSVLFDKYKKFLCFGYEAEEMYNDDRSDLSGCYFFQNFKMLLYKYKGQLNGCTDIEDSDVENHINSKMKAIDVFSAVIRHFKDELFKTLEKSYKGIKEDDIHWVLTVPAIWDLKAKQFMREAALKAGIGNDQLSLALEPEAASIYCRKLPMFVEEASVGDKIISQLSVGSKYLVLDLGGGTIDATVHKVLIGRKLKEVHQACGGEWGSYSINKEYYKFLCDIFGPDVMQKLHNDYAADVVDLMHDFETKKRSFQFENLRREERIKIPYILIHLYEELNGEHINTAIQRTKFSRSVRFGIDKLFIQNDVVSSFFEQTIFNIVSFLECLFQHDSVQGTKTILAVGGFSTCQKLIDTINAKFPELDIVVPLDADLAVLKGAILYAIEPESIVCRVSQYTYGVPKMMPYNPLRHNRKYAIKIGGRLMMDNIFDKHVEIGQVLNVGEFQPEHEYFPVRDDVTTAYFEFCASEEKNPDNTNGCVVLGIIHFDLVRHSFNQGRIFLKINASGTELVAIIREESTNEEIEGYFSLL